jgi:hypothetical protein
MTVRSAREIEASLMDIAARTQVSVAEYRADAVRASRISEHDWSIPHGLAAGVSSPPPAVVEDRTSSTTWSA